MKHHSIVCRLGNDDKTAVKPIRPDSQVTQISFIRSKSRLEFGLGQAIDQLGKLGLAPSETAIDLAILAALVTAADTRISRIKNSQDNWTREIDLHVPVADPGRWVPVQDLIIAMLDFLTGDRWDLYFRSRIAALESLAVAPQQLRIANPTRICLFSGGLDSFIGAADLLASGETPLLVSHYWDGVTSTHQTYCAKALRKEFKGKRIDIIRAHVGFPKATVKGSESDNTLRSRSFLFFSLAALAADAVGGKMRIDVPENGFISLNVPLDPLRLGSLSTRTTHPFFMARFNELLQKLGIRAELENRYRHMTKGEMIAGSKRKAFIAREARNTMSCSAPSKYRFDKDKDRRRQEHCGHCVPCLIRQAAMHKGLGKDDTPYIADLKARVLDTNRAEGSHVRSFQFALLRLDKNPKRAAFDIHRPGPLTDHPNDWKAYERVYIEGLREVGAFLTSVRARPQ